MSPVAEVAVTILPKTFPDFDPGVFFPYSVTEDYKLNDKLPYFKVESVGDTNGSFGSNQYNSRSYRVQVMAFIDIHKTDIEAMIDQLDRGMESFDYVQTYGEDRPHSENDKVHLLIRQYKTTRRK